MSYGMKDGAHNTGSPRVIAGSRPILGSTISDLSPSFTESILKHNQNRPPYTIFDHDVVDWCHRQNSTLMGKYFSIKDDEGKQEFAEWFMKILREIEEYKEEAEESANGD